MRRRPPEQEGLAVGPMDYACGHTRRRSAAVQRQEDARAYRRSRTNRIPRLTRMHATIRSSHRSMPDLDYSRELSFHPKLVQQLFFMLNALMTSVSSNVLSAQTGGQGTKAELYRIVAEQLQSLIRAESDWIANLANAAALIF